jgi:predicted deacylase
MIEETRVRCGRHHQLHDACLDLARTFDCGYILDQKGPDGQLARAVASEGVPAIDPELGGSVGWDDDSIAAGVDGVYNVLRAYDFLSGSVSPRTQIRAREFDQYGAPAGGLVHFEAELGDRVTTGQPLFRITDVFGTEKATISADTSGILWRTRRLPQVATGEYVCSVGTGLDEC